MTAGFPKVSERSGSMRERREKRVKAGRKDRERKEMNKEGNIIR